MTTRGWCGNLRKLGLRPTQERHWTSTTQETTIQQQAIKQDQPHVRGLAFGTYRLKAARAAAEVSSVLHRGIRHIDTAQLYKNEASVYTAIRDFEVAQTAAPTVRVVSKLHKNLLFEPAVEAVAASVRQLGRPLDAMLLHRPLPSVMWRALDACVDQGLVREIGVSNYSVKQLKDLLEICEPHPPSSHERGSLCRRPVLNQVEFHPFVGPVQPLLSFCKLHGIRVQGHTMLARGAFFDFPPLVRLAKKYERCPAVIMLRWAHQLGVELLFHSSNDAHVDEVMGQVMQMSPPIGERDMAEINGYHCTATRRFFHESPAPASIPELRDITDTEEYVETVAALFEKDLIAREGNLPVSEAALSLPTTTNKQLLTDPIANRIALRLFPVAKGKRSESSYQRYRDLVRSLRALALAARKRRPKPKRLSCALPAKHPVLQPPRYVRGEIVSPAVAHPAAMPVEVSSREELAPFFEFLADPEGFASVGLGGTQELPATFMRGTYFPDQRMDLCKQVVGAAHIGELCEAVLHNHDGAALGKDEAPPLTFSRGTYFADQRMDLCKQVVGPVHIAALCDAVETQSAAARRHRVRHFLLGNNIACDGESTEGASALGRLMANPTVEIETWYLAGNCVGPADMAILGQALSQNRSAQALWLKRNPLGAEGAASVGRLLGDNSTLRLLDLDNTGLFDEGIEAMVDSFLETGKALNLRHLYLSANALTGRSVRALGTVLTQSLPEPCSVVSLYLSLNRLQNDGLADLTKLMESQTLKTLLRLDIGAVGLLNPDLNPLVDALISHCPSLCSLDLGTYRSTRDMGEKANQLDADVSPLVRLLRNHPSLKLLDTTICGLPDASIERLVEALGSDQSLEGVGNHALRHSHSERRFLKQPKRVVHIDSIYRGRA